MEEVTRIEDGNTVRYKRGGVYFARVRTSLNRYKHESLGHPAFEPQEDRKGLCKKLERYLEQAPLAENCPALFQSQKGGALSADTLSAFTRHLRRLWFDGASGHSGRRTFITSLAAKGVGVRVLAELGGSCLQTQVAVEML